MMDKHFNMYDDIVRVPMMMRWPGRVPAGGACDAFVIHELDMATTVCEAAGLDVPETFEGRSLTAMVSGDDPEPRTEAYSMYQGAQQGLYSCRMVRDHEWKYVFNPSAVDELYHLPSDPGELRNRIDDPAAAEELKRLRGRMLTNMQAIRDPLLNPWMRAQLETE
jgi:arylsulfatase A-like enzyme